MKIFSSFFIAVVLFSWLAFPAAAQLGISPGSMDMTVGTGENNLPSITVRNDSEKPVDFEVKLAGYGQATDGNTQVLEPDTNPLSALEYIRFDPAQFHLEPGASQNIEVSASVPEDASGGRYAIVLVIGRPAADEPITTISRLGVLVRLTVDGSRLIQQGSIKHVGAGVIEPDKPIVMKVTYANEGNIHYKVRSVIAISDIDGNELEKVQSNALLVLPGYSREISADWIPDRDLEPGKYNMMARVLLEDGTLIDESEGIFEVGSSYIPPSLPVRLALVSTSASILRTEDGRFSISFPQGAVFSQVEISLESYPVETLKAPPSGYQLTSTSFKVDGLSGLLAREATVTVKYTPDDLNKAEGDVTRLRLARWNELESQWMVLETKPDREEMTISASTNQFSIWAIMVAPPAKTNWSLIGAAVAGVIVVVLLVYFLAIRTRFNKS